MFRIRDVGSAALLALLAASPRPTVAQTPGAAPPPTFKTGVDLVVVEAIAVDRSGAIAKGLSAADFEVEIGGDRREVVGVDLIAHGSTASESTRVDEASTPATGPDVSVNTAAVTSRRVLVVVDQGSLGPENTISLVAAARRWLGTVDPTDRIGLVALPPPGPVVEFTTNHQLVDEALTKVMPVGGVPPAAFSVKNIGLWEAVRIAERDTITRDLVIERECYPTDRLCPFEIDAAARDIAADVLLRVSPTLGALRNMLRAMRVLPGPKHAVLLSAGWPLDPQAIGSKLEPIAVAAASANVVLHAIVTERSPTEAYMRRISPTTVQDRNMLQTSVETLAGWTGGQSARATGEVDAAFKIVNDAMGGYYRLAVRPEPQDLDGKARRISVKVSRPGVSVRSHRRVIAISAEPEAPLTSDPEASLNAAILSAAPQTDLRLRATSYLLHEDESAPDRQRVLVAADITGAAAGAATVRLALFDENGRLVNGVDRDVEVHGDGPALVSAALYAPPGVYSLRIAARDGTGRVGSLDRDVRLRWHKAKGIETTDLALFRIGAAAGETPAPIVDVVRRDERLIAQLALSLPDANDTEPRPVVEITPEGSSAPLLRRELRVGRLADGRRWLAQASVSMNLLPPGRYSVTATVTPGAPPLSRTLDVVAGAAPVAEPTAPGAATTAGNAASGAPPAPAAARLALLALARPEAFDPASVLESGRVGPVLAQLAQRLNGSAREMLNGVSAGPWPTDSSRGPLASTPVAAHFVAGLGLLQAGQLESAAREFRTALRIAPDFAPTMAYLAACYAAGGKDSEAAAAWQTTSVREREAAWLQQLAIEAWLRAERPAAALALARRARERFPADPLFAQLQARAELADGRVREGLDTLASLDHADPSLLLMGLAALYTAAQDGSPVWDAARDRAAMTRWRDAYAAAGGESLPLVDAWLADKSTP